jgi:hypothetical protein
MRLRLTRFAVAIAAMFAVAAPAASAAPADFEGPLFGLAAGRGGGLLVADAGQGVVRLRGGSASLVAELPGINDVAPREGGGLWALTSNGLNDSWLYIVRQGVATRFANIGAFEKKRNPHRAFLETNPFDVADLGGGRALVADAAGNDLLRVTRRGKVRLVAVLPNQLVSTEHGKNLAGCPYPVEGFEFMCELPPMIPAESVPTGVAIGPDGAFYVGELKGIPAPTEASRVWRIERNARHVRCRHSPLCSVALDGFTSIIDLNFGPDGRLNVAQIDDESWLAMELERGVGGSVHACDLSSDDCDTVVAGVPILTAFAYRNDGTLWGTQNALIPGVADVVQLAP